MAAMDNCQDTSAKAAWMSYVLVLAGAYNLVWGVASILFPETLFHLAGMKPPRYPQLWQCVGMIVGVYGVGYLIAATAPLQHWPITLVGLLGKIFGPIGFAGAVISGDLPLAFGPTIVTNDLIWWCPFAAILLRSYRYHHPTAVASPIPEGDSNDITQPQLSN
jgi:hypothetical protein